MVSYKISVKTGDRKGAGTDANVCIILHGKGTQTSKYNLDHFFKNDFERGSVDNYSVDSDVNIPEVQRIELWRDNNGLLSSWYLDWIEVTNVATNITSIFPAMKWIKADNHYLFKHIDTCLPQDDPFKQKRMLELQTIRKDYQLQVKSPGLPAQIKELPDDETFSFDYQFNIGMKTKIYTEESKRLIMANGYNWKDVEDVKTVYTPVFGVPENSEYFNDDADFGRQRLASLNSLLITLCTAIPEKFGVTYEMVKPFLEGKTIEQAMEEKRLFIIDLAILEGCPAKTEDIFITCPFALFYFNNANHLMPIAIQLFQQIGTDNPVFLPSDPVYTWMLAKLWYNQAEATYHQALTHLNFTHFMMEGICVATKRNLSPSHPIFRLLNPHFIYLIAIDFLGLGVLVNPGGYFDKTSNGGINAAFYLMKKSMDFWRLDLHGTLPENLKSRGVLEQSVLTDAYQMRDDALLLYDAIKNYVQKYVTHYYSEKGSLKADYEIQNWGAEIVKSRDDGGVGILGVPNDGKFETTDQLVVTLTAIIYTCSVAHAAANFQQYDEYAAPFRFPFTMHGVPPKDKSPVEIETILKSIANRAELLGLMSITKVLSEKATQSLGDFEKQLIVDPPAVKLVNEFRQSLRNVGETIDERNKIRENPYDWLHPTAIPNSISI
ncbi:allene oxide synthase-lipoxygenase protein-like [Mytilus californianus]|uniref:allene oxide synthase-lipoxygenase protein-like n=1 Tax=Mytilus californianus TaxID=6549 RepID=UPI002247A86D|nr:allene oxide synthase-lipoxygenase protein-like [Mytilus californianus]